MNLAYDVWLEELYDKMVDKMGLTLEEAKEYPIDLLQFYYEEDLTPNEALLKIKGLNVK